MVTKKPVVKAKPARAAAREAARPKSAVKKTVTAVKKPLAKQLKADAALKTVAAVKGTVPAKPLTAKPVAPVADAARGARPGRKPKQSEEQLMGNGEAAVPEAGDDAADPGVQIVEKMSATKLRAKDRRAKEKALKEALERSYHGTEEDLEARRNKLKALIKLGKERGFLTYAEINDHLPDNLVDAEAIDSIISTFGDMGIQVFDQAPDAETLLMNENVPAATTDDDVEEEAEAALTTVDAEFGRTTDPVRMYMREMGSVELLTREGEIEIAKRIEDGLKHMVMAVSACPTTIAEILAHSERIRASEIPIDEVVDGLMDPTAEDFPTRRWRRGETRKAKETTDIGASGMTAAQLDELKVRALEKFDHVAKLFDKMRVAFEKEGYKSPGYLKSQTKILDELMSLRFTAKMVERLCGHAAQTGRRSAQPGKADLRDRRQQVRHAAPALPEGVSRATRPTCAGPRARPIPASRTPEVLRRNLPAVQELAGQAVGPAEARRAAAARPARGLQADGHRRGQGAQGQARDDRGQPAPGDLDRQEVHQPRPAVPRPDPGRQHRPDEGGRQVRIPSRLQVLDLRHVVDPPGDHAFDRRPGAHDPHPGAHDRDHQQDEPHQPADPAGNRHRARSGDAGGQDGDAGGQDPQDPEDRQGADLAWKRRSATTTIRISATSSRTQTTVAPVDAAQYNSLCGVTKDVLDSLTPREAKVLRMRFGIEMTTDHTLEEVGKQFDVTRERIRQIEAKALRKLRHPSRSDKLKSFLE